MAEIRAETIELKKLVRAEKSQMARLVRSVAVRVKFEILKAARSSLKTTYGDYVKGLQIEQVSDTKARLVLLGTIANMMEQGLGSGGIGTTGVRDMRKVLLKAGTRNLRGVPGSYYLHVPFTHTEGSIVAKGGGAAHTAATKLSATRSRSLGNGKYDTRWASSETGRLGSEFHKHLTGMVRMEKMYSAGSQSTYRTFRTISQRTTGGWMAKPIKARNFFEKIAMLVPRFTEEAPGEEELPLVVVQLSSENVEVQPLGGMGGWTPNVSTGEVAFDSKGVPSHASGIRDYFHYGIRQQVNISCYTEHPDLTRSLHYGLRAVMFAAQDWFLQSGYSTVEYQTATDLTTELELLFGYVRQMSWSAMRMEQINGITRLSKAIHVHMNDVIVNAKSGGTIAYND